MYQTQPSTLKEIRVHGSPGFPCAFYRTGRRIKGMMVKHHWHDEVEILYFSGGEFRLDVNMEQFDISGECFCFINPGELHSIYAKKNELSIENAVVFRVDTLSFADSADPVQSSLLLPIQNGSLLFPRMIEISDPAFGEIRDAFHLIAESFGKASFTGSELDGSARTDDITGQLYIKSSLLRILAVLCSHGMFQSTEKNHNRKVETIKTALTYIKENYRNKIYVRDLAELVGMNEQYFCRFFKKALGRPPIEYINEYRIKHVLYDLRETDMPVTEISLECGYNNLGNFLREFRKQTGTTPLQYRKQSRQADL